MLKLRNPVPCSKDRSGQSIIECAFVLPILLILVCGISEFGRAWLKTNVLTTAAREGARLAVVTTPDTTRVKNRVLEVCLDGGFEEEEITHITVVGPDKEDPQRRVVVTVEATIDVMTRRVLGVFNGAIPLRASAVMRHEAF